MKFSREHTEQGLSPYADIGFASLRVDKNLSSSPEGVAIHRIFEFPIDWSDEARQTFVDRFLVRATIPSNRIPISENDVPIWLWRHVPRDAATDHCFETSLCDVIDRICGSWTYHGWRAGYFDSEQDAETFYDESRWMLLHQRLCPPSSVWINGGRYWAYGQDVSDPKSFITDFRSGIVRRAKAHDLPPNGITINGVTSNLTGNGGAYDLWCREAEILANGGTSGVNVTNIFPPCSDAHRGAWVEVLDIGDSITKADNQAKRRITIDGKHPCSVDIVKHWTGKLHANLVRSIGNCIAIRHVQAIIDACHQHGNGSNNFTKNAALQFAIQTAHKVGLPKGLIERTQKLATVGVLSVAEDILGNHQIYCLETENTQSDQSAIAVRLDDSEMDEAWEQGSHVDKLFQALLFNSYSGGKSSLNFKSTAEAWNTCKEGGPIQSTSSDGSFMFLDDTVSEIWALNVSGFLFENSGFNVPDFEHTVSLAATVADLHLITSTAVTPRMARRMWDYRPISLSLTGISHFLMATGVPYDSPAGRAYCAAIGALLTSTMYLTSGRIAAEIGHFPEYKKNAAAMTDVMVKHSKTTTNCVKKHIPRDLVNAAKRNYFEAVRFGSTSGFRNAQVSLIADCGDLTAILNCESVGLLPKSSLVLQKSLLEGKFVRSINLSVIMGLRSLGYNNQKINAIVQHVVGRNTLLGAPGVNHETLRKRGFTDSTIKVVERSLTSSVELSQVFSPFVIGDDYCVDMLGFTQAELKDDNFNLLAELGFSDAGIEAANIYCFGSGSMEGAPYLKPEHLEVFDCAKPQGQRSARYVSPYGIVKMMGALQPHISGSIGQLVNIPDNWKPDEIRELYLLAWRLGTKSITLQQQKTQIKGEFGLPSYSEKLTEDHYLPVELEVIQGGHEKLSLNFDEQNSKELNSDLGIVDSSSESNVAGGSETSRCANSHAARGTASVASSADAVVEQRQV